MITTLLNDPTASRTSLGVSCCGNNRQGLEEIIMQVVLIDTFVVPDASRTALVKAARESAAFLRTLPGFVEGYIFEKTGGDSPHTIVTTAVWQDQAAFENAQKSAAAEFQRVGFNPREIMSNLNVTIQRAMYQRSSY